MLPSFPDLLANPGGGATPLPPVEQSEERERGDTQQPNDGLVWTGYFVLYREVALSLDNQIREHSVTSEKWTCADHALLGVVLSSKVTNEQCNREVNFWDLKVCPS